eukprot:COSAG02_NODE_1441_length_12586_cov_484.135581_7_plen_154_part_00
MGGDPPEVGDRVRVKFRDQWEVGDVTRVEGDEFWVEYPLEDGEGMEEWGDPVSPATNFFEVLTRQKWGHFPSPSKREEEGVKKFLGVVGGDSGLTLVQALVALRRSDSGDPGEALDICFTEWAAVAQPAAAGVAAAAAQPAAWCKMRASTHTP